MKFTRDRKGENSVMRKGKISSTALDVDLDRQLQCWRENPSWTDEPAEVKVRNGRKVLLFIDFNVRRRSP